MAARSGHDAVDHDEATGASTPPVADPLDLIAAERAGTAYWRDVARQRRIDAARVQRRPIVRVAVALDRHTRGAQDVLARSAARLGDLGRRAAVVGPGVARRISTADRPGAHAAAPPPRVSAAGATLVVRVVDGALNADPGHGADRAGPDVTEVSLGDTLVGDIDLLVMESRAQYVVVLGPSARPPDDWTWLDHLAAAITGPVVAATPQVVHPRRPWWAATTQDLLVRGNGLDIQVDEGAPVAVARHAGRRPDPSAAPQEVAAGASALLVHRAAWIEADGLTAAGAHHPEHADDPAAQVDGLLVDLCMRLRRNGGQIVAIAAAGLVDDRPVHDRAALTTPIDPGGPTWRAVVEHHGPALIRASDRTRHGARPMTVALSTATPSLKLASRSGDWHFAQDLAAALRRSGCEVRTHSAEEADSLAGRSCDIHLVLRGLEPVRRTSGQRHVLWIISHPEAIEAAECDEADLVLVASKRYATHLRSQTSTPVEVLQQATDPGRFGPRPSLPAHQHRLMVVANARGGQRAAVADAFAAGLRPSVYGEGWEGRIAAEQWAGSYLGPAELPVAYASAEVVLNDHWDTMRHWGFVSNRIFDVLACGTPVVSDHLPEITELFGDVVPTWRDPGQLRQIVEVLWSDPSGAADLAAKGRHLVLEGHTFDHRAAELHGLLARHGLIPDGVDP